MILAVIIFTELRNLHSSSLHGLPMI